MPAENENIPAATVPPPAPATGITQEQLHAAIEKARNEERTKLRAEIETAQNANKADAAKVVELNQSVQKLTSELTTLKANIKPEGGIDVSKVIEDTVASVQASLNQNWQEKYNILEQRVIAADNERQRLTVEQTRARLIQVNGGDNALIPSLVVGNNEAELLASIERSKAEFQRIRQIVGGTQTPPSQQQHGQGSGTPPVLPAIPAGSGAPAGGSPQPGISPRRMSREEYGKSRVDLKRAAVARYPTNAVTQ